MLTIRLERLLLLVHLLRSQNKGFKDGNFAIQNLIDSTKGIHHKVGKKGKDKHWTLGYVEQLEEIYRVRKKELEWEEGGIGDQLSNC